MPQSVQNPKSITWHRFDDARGVGYEADGMMIFDNGAGMGGSRGSGRWAVEVAGQWVANVDTLADAKRHAADAPKRVVSTDPRGPLLTVESVRRTPEGNMVRFVECEHEGHFNATMDVRVGAKLHCFACRATPSKAMKRADVHAPSKLDPADYVWIGSEDAHTGDEYEFEFDWQRFAELTGRPEVAGRDYRDGEGIPWAQVVHASGSKRGCAHCGQTRIRYWAFYLHTPTGEVVAVGHACAVKLSLNSKHEIAQRVQAERRRLDELLTAWRAADERNERAWDELMTRQDEAGGSGGAGNDFVDSLVRYAGKHGCLTDGQRDAVLKGIEARERRAVEQREKGEKMGDPEPADVPLTGDRITVTGRLLSTKSQDNGYREELKMLVLDDRGFRVFGTLPSDIVDQAYEQASREGLTGPRAGVQQALEAGMKCRVRFDATVSRSRQDTTFGFFNRPTKAKVI